MTRSCSEEGRKEGRRRDGNEGASEKPVLPQRESRKNENPFRCVEAVTDEIKQQFRNFQTAPVRRERFRTAR